MRNREEQARNFRDKAEEALTLADSLKGEEPRRFLMTVANDYLLLATALEDTNLGDMIPASE